MIYLPSKNLASCSNNIVGKYDSCGVWKKLKENEVGSHGGFHVHQTNIPIPRDREQICLFLSFCIYICKRIIFYFLLSEKYFINLEWW